MLGILSPPTTVSRDLKDLADCPRITRQHVGRPVRIAASFTLTTVARFEKDLYDLIRGLRNHKGSERAYLRDSIRECRKEVKGSDMGEHWMLTYIRPNNS